MIVPEDESFFTYSYIHIGIKNNFRTVSSINTFETVYLDFSPNIRWIIDVEFFVLTASKRYIEPRSCLFIFGPLPIWDKDIYFRTGFTLSLPIITNNNAHSRSKQNIHIRKYFMIIKWVLAFENFEPPLSVDFRFIFFSLCARFRPALIGLHIYMTKYTRSIFIYSVKLWQFEGSERYKYTNVNQTGMNTN